MADLDAASLEDFAISSRPTTPRTTPCWQSPVMSMQKLRSTRSGNTSKAFQLALRRRRWTPPSPRRRESAYCRQRSSRAAAARRHRVSRPWRHQSRHGCALSTCHRHGLGPQLPTAREPRSAATAAVQTGAGRRGQRATFMYLEGMAVPERIQPRWKKRSTPSGKDSAGHDSGMGARQGDERRATKPGSQPGQSLRVPFCSRATPRSTPIPKSSTRATSALHR